MNIFGNLRSVFSSNKYYIYVYLDIRKPGTFIYGDLVFDFEPFYIGKGKSRRAIDHIYEANSSNKNNPKLNTIRKIIKETNTIPCIRILEMDLEDDLAYDLEIKYINVIGRKALKHGPLLNLTDGGEGLRNPSEYTRNLISKAFLGKPSPKTHYLKSAFYKSSTKGRILSDEEKALISTLTTGENNPNAKLSQKDVDDIRNSIKNGASLKELSEFYNISKSTISAIKTYRIWNKIQCPMCGKSNSSNNVFCPGCGTHLV